MNAIAGHNLGAKGEWFEIIRDNGRTVDCSEACECLYGRLQRNRRGFEALFLLFQECADIRKWWNDRIREWLDDRIQPQARVAPHHEQCPATSMGPHSNGNP